MRSRSKLKIFILLICFLAVGFFSYQAGLYFARQEYLGTPPSQIINSEVPENLEEKTDFSVFWETWRELENKFLDKEKIDYQEMIYGAIEGMVSSLEDPYTIFFSPQETEDFEEELSGKYEGVGMEVAITDGVITVVTPLEGTPAQEAGLRPKDKILKIDDVSTEGMALEKAVSLIRGPKDTTVNLLIDRKDWENPKTITLKRSVIKIPTFKLEFETSQDGSGVAVIKIYQFNKILNGEFNNGARQILDSSVKKIILDLRNNPGGYLDVAQKIAGWFLERGEIVAWQESGPEKERKAYKAEGPGSFSQYPMVVLINEGSASGAEILAGALRDNRQIKLIGEKSFGKGSVQQQIFLFDNSSLKITIAKWLTPDGYSINEKGLEPDIKVELGEEEDSQLEKALEVINDL